jgi:hypothetical protein
VANDDAQHQLDSFSEELGLHECHHLAFSMQYGRLRPKKERFARLPAFILCLKDPEESEILDWKDYKVINHYHWFGIDGMSEHLLPNLWDQLVNGCVLDPKSDLTDCPSAVQNAFAVWGTPNVMSDTHIAVNCFAQVLKNATLRMCKGYGSSAGKKAISSIRVVWVHNSQ